MKLTSLFLVAFLAFPSTVCAKVPLKSIQRLGDVHEDGSNHNFCTTWATRVNNTVRWVTASHCVHATPEGAPDMEIKYIIGGKPAKLLMVDPEVDLALFEGPSAPPLMVALGNASMGQKVFMWSYFMDQGIYTEGVASGLNENGKMTFNLAGGPGASGAPVLSDGNLVVGVVQSGPCPYPCPVFRGADVLAIRKFLFLA